MEEEQFSKTLSRGMNILNEALEALEGTVIPGELVFKLYDTYGFPTDLTADVAREHDYTIDEDGFQAAMQAQRKRAQEASQFGADYNDTLRVEQETAFTGYDNGEQESNVVELICGNDFCEQLTDGQEGVVVLDSTPFYAESGGQVGDTGVLKVANGEFLVTDTQKLGNAFAHKGIVKGVIQKGDKAAAKIDDTKRTSIRKNHSATHLLHAALREVLGDHVTQKGSLVNAERLRFDFSHFESVTAEQLLTIEQRVNEEIQANHALTTQLMDLDEAKASGAMALFGEKYDEKVRVVSMGPFSTELCGGTHVKQTGDIGLFKIISEGGIASGVRRIEAVSGMGALAFVQQQQAVLQQAASLLKTDALGVAEKVAQTQTQQKELEKTVTALKQKLASQQGADVLSNIVEINGVKALIAELEGVEAKSLRGMVDDLKNRIGEGVIVLGVPADGKVSLIAGVTKGLTSKVKAGELINFIAAQVGGKGGGRPDMAQAGGSQPENLSEALQSVNAWLKDKL